MNTLKTINDLQVGWQPIEDCPFGVLVFLKSSRGFTSLGMRYESMMGEDYFEIDMVALSKPTHFAPLSAIEDGQKAKEMLIVAAEALEAANKTLLRLSSTMGIHGKVDCNTRLYEETIESHLNTEDALAKMEQIAKGGE